MPRPSFAISCPSLSFEILRLIFVAAATISIIRHCRWLIAFSYAIALIFRYAITISLLRHQAGVLIRHAAFMPLFQSHFLFLLFFSRLLHTDFRFDCCRFQMLSLYFADFRYSSRHLS